jgi:hypothetical protein
VDGSFAGDIYLLSFSMALPEYTIKTWLILHPNLILLFLFPKKQSAPGFLTFSAEPGDQCPPESIDQLNHNRNYASDLIAIFVFQARRGLVNFVWRGLLNASVSSRLVKSW